MYEVARTRQQSSQTCFPEDNHMRNIHAEGKLGREKHTFNKLHAAVSTMNHRSTVMPPSLTDIHHYLILSVLIPVTNLYLTHTLTAAQSGTRNAVQKGEEVYKPGIKVRETWSACGNSCGMWARTGSKHDTKMYFKEMCFKSLACASFYNGQAEQSSWDYLGTKAASFIGNYTPIETSTTLHAGEFNPRGIFDTVWMLCYTGTRVPRQRPPEASACRRKSV